MIIYIILFLILIPLLGIITWSIYVAQRMQCKRTSEEPLLIAEKRYARGEITKQQFDQLKQDLA